MDHLRRRTLRFDNLHTIVLDEADEMLNMGFREDIETILKDAPEERQTVLFSATMPKPIMDITKNYQKDAVLVRVAIAAPTTPSFGNIPTPRINTGSRTIFVARPTRFAIKGVFESPCAV